MNERPQHLARPKPPSRVSSFQSPVSSAFHPRGSAYITVLGVAMIISVIGLSAVLAARIELRAASQTGSAVQARFAAQSAIELSLNWMAADPNWRTNYFNDTWSTEQTIAGIGYSLKLVDELDGDLSNDAAQPVRLYGRATVGDATRIYSVLLQPDAEVAQPGNLLTNGDMESGVSNWFELPSDDVDLESHTDSPHSGLAYMWVKNRGSTSAGPAQDVTSKVASGHSYRCTVWVRTKDEPEPVRVQLIITTVVVKTYVYSTEPVVGTTWTRVEVTLAPGLFVGLLQSAHLQIRTTTSKQEFMVDDAVLVEDTTPSAVDLTPIPGTWRREITP